MIEREAYREDVEARLLLLEAWLDVLRVQAKGARPDTCLHYEEWLRASQEKRRIARTYLNQLGASEDKSWDQLKGGVEAALIDLQSTLDGGCAELSA
jgi:hypothetical protein